MQCVGYVTDGLLVAAVVSDAELRVAGAVCCGDHDVRWMRSEVSVGPTYEELAVVHLGVRFAVVSMSMVMTPPPRSLVRR